MIVTVAFREPYLTHSYKQLESIDATSKMWWHDSLPTKGQHEMNITGKRINVQKL